MPSRTRIADRWHQVPDAIGPWFAEQLGPSGIAVYNSLAKHSNAAGVSFPRIATIAKESGVSKRTVIRALKTLQDVGLVRKHKRGQGNRNEYQLLPVNDSLFDGQLAVVQEASSRSWSGSKVHLESATVSPSKVPQCHFPTNEPDPLNQTQEPDR